MSKQQLKLWKSDKPEPRDYNQHADPLHKNEYLLGCDDQVSLINRLTTAVKNWMDNPASPLDTVTKALKKEWISIGGSSTLFDSALESAIMKSGYYKKFLKGIK